MACRRRTMRRVHVPTPAKMATTSEVAATGVPSAAPVLCQSNGSLQTGAGQRTGCNQHNFSKDRTAKHKARHTGTLPAASEVEAARFARIVKWKSNLFRC